MTSLKEQNTKMKIKEKPFSVNIDMCEEQVKDLFKQVMKHEYELIVWNKFYFVFELSSRDRKWSMMIWCGCFC